ncbi:MAG: hypothetical protein COA38_03740 [Fluviicola sp.]|nr:MAG: hypothetical protein COA38_03740 [Fluviicola sp.]
MNAKRRPSILKEILCAIAAFFFGDISSKIGFALFTMLMGIIVLACPITDLKGNNLEKSFIPYALGSTLIILSIYLIISWLRGRKASNQV